MAQFPSKKFWKIGFGTNLSVDTNFLLKVVELQLLAQTDYGVFVPQTPIAITGNVGVVAPENMFDGNVATYATFPVDDYNTGVVLEFAQEVALVKVMINNTLNCTDDEFPKCMILSYGDTALSADNDANFLINSNLNVLDLDRAEQELGVRRKITWNTIKTLALPESGVYENLSIEASLVTFPGEVSYYGLASYSIWYAVTAGATGINPVWESNPLFMPFPIEIPANQEHTVTLCTTDQSGYESPVLSRTYTIANQFTRDISTKSKFWRFSFTNQNIWQGNNPTTFALVIGNLTTEVLMDNTEVALNIKPTNVTGTGITSVQNVIDASRTNYALIPVQSGLIATIIYEYAGPVNISRIFIDDSMGGSNSMPRVMIVESSDNVNGPWKRRAIFVSTNADWSNTGAPYKQGYMTFVMIPSLANVQDSGAYTGGIDLNARCSWEGKYPMGETNAAWNLVYNKDRSPLTANSPTWPDYERIIADVAMQFGVRHIASRTLGPVYKRNYLIDRTAAVIGLKTGLAANAGTAVTVPGELLLSTDETMLYIGDEYGGKEAATTVHIGDNQPLANKQVWIDSSNMEIKYNTGTTWETRAGDPSTTNLGGFIDEILASPAGGQQYNITPIVLTSLLGRDIYYTIDGTEPTIASPVYMGELPMFTGTLKAKSLSPTESPTLTLVFESTIPKAISIVRIDQLPLRTGTAFTAYVNPDLISESLYFYATGYQEDIYPTYYLASETNWETQIFPGNPVYSLLVDYTLGRTVEMVLAKADGTIVEKLEIPLAPAAPVLNIPNPPVAEGDSFDIYFDEPIYGGYWSLYVTYDGSTPTLASGSILDIPGGNIFVTVTPDMAHPGSATFTAIFNRASMLHPENTRVTATPITVTIPGTYVPPPPAQYWQGYGVTFEKTGTDPAVEKDEITPLVALSRGSDGGFFNVYNELSYLSNVSPKKTKWAFCGLGPNANGVPEATFNTSNLTGIIFTDWRTAHSQDAPATVGTTGILWLQEENIYLDILVTAWGGAGDTFAWTRSTATSVRVVPPPVQVFTGFDVAFTRLAGDDEQLVSDPLTAGVVISRQNAGGPIFNIAQETSYAADSSPAGTLWAFEGYNVQPIVAPFNATNYAAMKFAKFKDAIDGNPPNAVGTACVCWLKEENIYLDVLFSVWGVGAADAGEFSYTRSTLPEIVGGIRVPNGPKNAAGAVWSDLTKIVNKPAGMLKDSFADVITPELTITSFDSNSTMVSSVEASHTLASPIDVEFAFAGIMNNPVDPALVIASEYNKLAFGPYEQCVIALGSAPVDIAGVMHIKNSSVYLDFKLLSVDFATGAFSYARAEKPLALGYWKGSELNQGALEFTKPDYTSAAAYQDTISPTVTLTRDGTGQLYNITQEAIFVQNVSPLGAKFAFENLGPNLGNMNVTADAVEAGTSNPVFTDIRTANGNNSGAMVDKRAVMYLEAEKIYLDLKITAWSLVNGAGGFSYRRARPTVTMLVEAPVGIADVVVDGITYAPGVHEVAVGTRHIQVAGDYALNSGATTCDAFIQMGSTSGNFPVASPGFVDINFNVTEAFTIQAKFV